MADLATSNRFYDVRDLENEFKKTQDLKLFNYTLLLSASNDFSIENKLGQGGFGAVYKVIWNHWVCIMYKFDLLNDIIVFVGILGNPTKWRRSCHEKTFQNIYTRNWGIQKWTNAYKWTSTHESCTTTWILHSWGREDLNLWVYVKQKLGFLSIRWGI